MGIGRVEDLCIERQEREATGKERGEGCAVVSSASASACPTPIVTFSPEVALEYEG